MEDGRCKLGLAGRLELVLLIERGATLRAAAAALGVAPATAHRWWHRWREACEQERSSRSCLRARPPVPRSCPWRLAAVDERVRSPTIRSMQVRLNGIDTPESRRPGTPVECGAKRASANMQRLALGSGGTGRKVRLVTDPTQDTFDRYGRLLVYTYLVFNNRRLQTEQLRAGWAKAYVFGGQPFRLVDSFRRSQSQARRARWGVWGLCGGDFHKPA